MPANWEVDAVFFDLGGTLGEPDPQTGQLVPHPSGRGLLRTMRDVHGLRVGVIATLGPKRTRADGLAFLHEAGFDRFLDPDGFISDHDAGVAKPDVAIYQLAARRFALPPGRCLFVGENLPEVLGAIAAGMKAILKPSPPGRESPDGAAAARTPPGRTSCAN
jgi:FMN phosphatase YigB (HAD superfamily)